MAIVARGLVIDDRWVSLILAGRKTWEMRSQATNIRGTIALITKGTGKGAGVHGAPAAKGLMIFRPPNVRPFCMSSL